MGMRPSRVRATLVPTLFVRLHCVVLFAPQCVYCPRAKIRHHSLCLPEAINWSFAAFAGGNGRCPAAPLSKFTDAIILRITGRLSLKPTIASMPHSELMENSARQGIRPRPQ